MSISKDELIKKQDELQKSFDTMRDRIKSMDIEIGIGIDMDWYGMALDVGMDWYWYGY